VFDIYREIGGLLTFGIPGVQNLEKVGNWRVAATCFEEMGR